MDRNDVFVDPAVEALQPRGRRTKSVLFSISDRPAQEALGIWREDKGAH